MYKFFTNCVLLMVSFSVFAQTPTSLRMQSYAQFAEQSFPLDSVKFRNVGPTVMSGRVVDIEVNPKNVKEFFVAYASGGIWYTNNNGLKFEPIFDNEACITIGDMAMNWDKNMLWVGTGEVNSSRSSYAGTGMYKSNNRGKTWTYIGLGESHHIGKIILSPKDENTAWVAVLGHLYTQDKNRGMYKTIDGGMTWTQNLFINDSTGCVDALLDAENENNIYAVSWTRTRKAWNFNGSGAASGIYKSEDGGAHWKLLTNENSGFPQGDGLGRIGIAQAYNKKNVFYALLDNQAHQEKEQDKNHLQASDVINLSEDEFLKLDDKKLNAYLQQNNYPEKYTAESIKEDVRQKKFTVKQIAEWRLADADASLFDTPIYGAEVYRSDDDGLHWKKVNKELLTGVYFTYGYYFGTIAVSPQDENNVWIAGYPILQSKDGGKSFLQKDGDNCHPDYHRIWINPLDEKHLIVGNDGGVNISYDGGGQWIKCNSPAVGQFYAVAVDEAEPYNVYGGLQDNGSWKGNSRHQENTAWHQSGNYGYENFNGGDGMQVQVDFRDNKTLYSGYQFGYYTRKGFGKRLEIHPNNDIGEKAYRFNWQTPICLSRHNEDILYYGSNCFHRSMNKGADMKKLSDDLSSTNKKGNVPFGTLTSICESPLKFGLLYVGTDDGNIWCSQDVGYTWNKISTNLPQGLWVSRVCASKFVEGRLYATLNGYRNDDFKAYSFRSDDYGKNWKAIGENLPYEPLNVIKEDIKNENIVYVGSDNGLYVSYDMGKSFIQWRGNLPRVAVHDMVIQEKENELVLGTHGRSIYIASLDLVQRYAQIKDSNLYLVPISEKNYSDYLGTKFSSYDEPMQSKLPIQFYSKKQGMVQLKIYNSKNKLVKVVEVSSVAGWNVYDYNYQVDEDKYIRLIESVKKRDDGNYYLCPDNYTIEISQDGDFTETELKIIRRN